MTRDVFFVYLPYNLLAFYIQQEYYRNCILFNEINLNNIVVYQISGNTKFTLLKL